MPCQYVPPTDIKHAVYAHYTHKPYMNLHHQSVALLALYRPLQHQQAQQSCLLTHPV